MLQRGLESEGSLCQQEESRRTGAVDGGEEWKRSGGKSGAYATFLGLGVCSVLMVEAGSGVAMGKEDDGA